MMAERKPIHIEPTSETAKLLELAEERPVTVESRGTLYRIESEEQVTLENYDPAKALASLRSGIGLYEGIDSAETIREQR
ncbi:hypothetical protein BH24CHL4_BH24CHL4_04060 [soil metagenome]